MFRHFRCQNWRVCFSQKTEAVFYAAGQADNIKAMPEEHESSGGLGVLFIKLGKIEFRARAHGRPRADASSSLCT